MAQKTLRILALIIFSFFCFSRGLMAKPELKAGLLDFAPCFYQEGDEVKGFIVEKLRKILDRAGYDLTCAVYPMKRIRDFLNTGVFDFTTCLTDVFAEGEILATDYMIYKIRLMAYTKGKKDSILKKEDLSGKKIGIYRGFTYGGWINYIKDPANNVQYYEVSQHEQLFKMLDRGRIDYVMNYLAPSDVVLDNITIANLEHNEVMTHPVYMLVANDSSDKSKEIIKNLNIAYAELIEEGQMIEER